MSEWVNILFPVLLFGFQGHCLQYFYGSFLEGRMRDPRKNGLAAAVSYAALRLAISWAGAPEAWDYRAAAVKMAATLCLLLALAFCFYRTFTLLTIFLAAAFQAIADISRYAAVILLGELGEGLLGFWNWCAGKGVFASARAFSTAVGAGLAGEWLLEYLAMVLLLRLSLQKIVNDFREKDYGIHRTELLFLLTPAATGLMICLLLRIIIITMEDGVPRILYDKYPILIAALPAILLLSLLSILCGVKLFQDMIDLNREKSGRMVLEKQVASLQEHMDEMERVYSGIRSVKHDMKNTLLVIERLSVAGGAKENPELRRYLAGLNRTFEELEVRFKTGNAVVDALLHMKSHEAAREAPGLQIDAEELLFSPKLQIHSYDIGVILGNALDNAIEACRKLKEKEPEAEAYIRLCSLQKGNFLILQAENSFDGRLARWQEGLPATDKADKKLHGIGLANIKSTAEKYQGTMDFKIKGRTFLLSVMMKNERGGENGFWSDQ